jgi:hypothetical protein
MKISSKLIDIEINRILVLVVEFHQRSMELLYHNDSVLL